MAPACSDVPPSFKEYDVSSYSPGPLPVLVLPATFHLSGHSACRAIRFSPRDKRGRELAPSRTSLLPRRPQNTPYYSPISGADSFEGNVTGNVPGVRSQPSTSGGLAGPRWNSSKPRPNRLLDIIFPSRKLFRGVITRSTYQ